MKTITFFRNLLRIVILILMIGMTSSHSTAGTRVSSLIVTKFSGGYTTIVGQPSTGYLGGNGVYYPYDSPSPYRYLVTMPFAFNYDNIAYSVGQTLYVQIGSAGFTDYTSQPPYYYNTIVPYFGLQASQFQNSMAPMTGLQMPTGVYYQTSGAAPNRVLTIEWYNCGDYPSRSLGTCSYQLKLYESTNVIEFIYEKYNFLMTNASYAGTYYKGTGLNGSTNPSFVQNIINGSTSNNSTPATNIRFSPPLPVELSTSPKNITFGAVGVGAFVTQNITISNVGPADGLIVGSLSLTGSSDFSISAGTPVPTLASGQNAIVTVKFAPTAAGVRSAVLSVISNGLDSGLQTINLNGSGLAPLIFVDSTILFKKTRTHLGDSLTQWIHITNTGGALLTINSLPITGIDGDQYFISHFPTNPIFPGFTDSLSVTYVPTREGLRMATMTINSNAVNTPVVVVTVRGTGILPHIVVTPSLLLFDSTREGSTICKTITIWNSGSDTLRLFSNVLTSNDGDFQYTGLSDADTRIPPDHTKDVTICFTPKQQGYRQARLLLRTNIIQTFETPRRDTASIVTVDIRGTGVPFGIFANSVSGSPFLDSALIGATICRTDTIWNVGDADILLNSLAIAGVNANDFTASGIALPILLKARSHKTFTLCGTPDAQGLLVGTLTASGTTSSSPITLNIPLGIFGQKACASPNPIALFLTTDAKPIKVVKGMDSTMCVTVTNCGDLPASYMASLSGSDKADYTILTTPNPTATIPPGGTVDLCVKFNDPAVGVTDARLLIKTTGVADMTIPLTGEGACASPVSDVPSVPNTGASETKQFTFAINNKGNYDWSPGAAVIAGTGSAAFKFISVAPNPIAAGGQGIVTMEFHPTDKISYVANLTFPNAGPCQDAAVSIDLNGLGITSSVSAPASSSDGFTLQQSYPNPTQGNASFTYVTPSETEVRITLVDLTGKFIRTLIAGRVSKGQHLVNFTAANLTSGTYAYILESGSTRLVRQLILTK